MELQAYFARGAALRKVFNSVKGEGGLGVCIWRLG